MDDPKCAMCMSESAASGFADGCVAFESQAAYLKRLGLLQPAEAVLPRAAFNAETLETHIDAVSDCWCWDSNPDCADFKSTASASWATPASNSGASPPRGSSEGRRRLLA